MPSGISACPINVSGMKENRMMPDSNMNRSFLKKVIRDEFGIDIASFTPVPKAEAVRAYSIESANGNRFFLKLYLNDTIPNSAFRFAHDLSYKVGISNVVHPIRAKSGQLRIPTGESYLALFNLVAGKTAEEIKFNDGQLEKLGELLAKIHQSKKIIGEYVVKENFEISFEAKFFAVFGEIDKLSQDSPEYRKKVRLFLDPHREKFMEELATLRELQNKVRRMDLEFVNCHGEPSPGNVLSSDNNEVYLLDWDEPIFAPKEKDLLFFKDNIEPVMRGYRRCSENTIVNGDLIEFYGHMWNLGEIADYGSRILFENNSDLQNQTWLDNWKGGWDFAF
jgi:spectinomycin phosphotransferase